MRRRSRTGVGPRVGIGPSAGVAVLLAVSAGCFGEPPEAPPLESAELVVPAFDSAVVGLEEGRGEVTEGGSVVWTVGLTDWVLRYDVDEDGDEDAVVVTYGSGGGSGMFYELTLFSFDRDGPRDAGRWTWQATSPLGDRVRMRAATLDGSTVELHLTEHGPDDPQCCPTVETTRRWRVEEGVSGLTALDPATTEGRAR